MKYFVDVGGREFVVEVDGGRVTVDGMVIEAHLSRLEGTPLWHLLLGDASCTLVLDADGRGRWRAERFGERWEVEVVDERTRHVRSLTGGGTKAAGPPVLKAPMPGLVVRVPVGVGDTVAAGAGVVVLEAMKMENELRAQAGGRVSAVHVRPGQAVEKGQVLVEFAPTTLP
ncbi:MAG TPA: biotin/lipoyl-containing protein [Gemmatimonadales bacterium]|nr:biotin/lipoyl-containing protein [Gemmatimonadales bacterium]